MTTCQPGHTPNQDQPVIFKVDPPSGRLRLALMLVGFFITWSLLATLTSFYNPLPNLPSLVGKSSGAAANLAQDLLDVMLADYFSAFTLLNLATFLLICLAGFRQARTVVAEALQLSQPRKAASFLRSCGLSMPAALDADPSAGDFLHSDENTIISALGGPCCLRLDPQVAILVEDGSGHHSLVVAEEQNEKCRIEHQEKISAIFPASVQEFHLNFSAVCEDGKKIYINNLRAAAANPIIENQLDATRMAQVDQLDIGELLFFTGSDWGKFAQESLQAEISTILLGCTSHEIREQIGTSISNQSTQTQVTRRIVRSHSATRHNSIYNAPGRIAQKHNTRLGLRNRRRSMMPELHSIEPEVESRVEPVYDFQVRMQSHLSQSFKDIYNNAVIEPRIIHLGEISFNEIP